MKCVQHDLQRLLHEPPPNHAKVQQIDQLRTDAQQKFADLMFQVGAVHDSLEGIQESSVEAHLRAELQQDGASQMLEQLRTELQQVQSRQGDLDAAIKEQHAKLTGGADEAPCTLADCLAQHNELHERIDEILAWCNSQFDEIYNRLGHLEEEIYTAEELAAFAADAPVEHPYVHERLAKLDVQIQKLAELREVQRVHPEHAAQMEKLTAQLQGLQKQQEQQSEVLAQKLWQKVQDLERQQQADAQQVRDLEQQQQADAQKVRDLERQQEDANGRGLLQFETEQLRNDETLLSSKELAFDDPPRISPGSFTTPPGFSGGRGGQLMRPSASRTHTPPSSHTPAFPHEQAKLQDNDPRGGQLTRSSRSSAPWPHSPPSSRTPAFPHEQTKLQDNDPRPSPYSNTS